MRRSFARRSATRTRLIVVNTPHNPTGKVFSREELSLIAELCVKHDVIAVTDEVYERLTFERAAAHSPGVAAGDGGPDGDALEPGQVVQPHGVEDRLGDAPLRS
jgi:aspartate/methionine/tyrosine aminotransferase